MWQSEEPEPPRHPPVTEKTPYGVNETEGNLNFFSHLAVMKQHISFPIWKKKLSHQFKQEPESHNIMTHMSRFQLKKTNSLHTKNQKDLNLDEKKKKKTNNRYKHQDVTKMLELSNSNFKAPI